VIIEPERVGQHLTILRPARMPICRWPTTEKTPTPSGWQAACQAGGSGQAGTDDAHRHREAAPGEGLGDFATCRSSRISAPASRSLSGHGHGLSSRPMRAAVVRSRRQVDEYRRSISTARSNYLAAESFTDLRVVFQKWELRPSRPTRQVHGYTIQKGKLSVDFTTSSRIASSGADPT